MLISYIIVGIMIESNEAICIEHGFRDRGEREYLATHSVIDDGVREDMEYMVNRIEASRGWRSFGTAPVAST